MEIYYIKRKNGIKKLIKPMKTIKILKKYIINIIIKELRI